MNETSNSVPNIIFCKICGNLLSSGEKCGCTKQRTEPASAATTCTCLCHSWYKEGLHCSVCKSSHLAPSALTKGIYKPQLNLFQHQEDGHRTLKLSPASTSNLLDLIGQARGYIDDNINGVTRIEFPYQGLYYVIAKLKDRT